MSTPTPTKPSRAATRDPRHSAREPLQQRAKDRVAQVLQEAEALILRDGIAEFSIPVLAERLGFPRGTIYKFFPTPYAIFNEMALRHVTELEQHLAAAMAKVDTGAPWQTALQSMIRTAVDYYAAHPVACPLLLGGPLTDGSFHALELSITRLGRLTRRALENRGLKLPTRGADVAALAVEIGTASFRLSYFKHGRITPAYRDAAADAMIAYLSSCLLKQA